MRYSIHPNLNSNTNLSSQLVDNFGREINYLRISITDRCNLRCNYCMPSQGINFLPFSLAMTFGELERLIHIFVGLGITKVRFTGGEPFARHGFFDFLQKLDAQSLNASFHITTNGILAEPHLKNFQNLKRLGGVNLSFHTLKKERYSLITGRDEFGKAQRVLSHLLTLDIPLKINCVVQKEINSDELGDFVNLTRDFPIEVRFIEKMPFNGGQEISGTMRAKEIIAAIQADYPNLTKLLSANSTADRYKIEGFKGTVGIIAGYSRLFCNACNRVRITASGNLQWCLYDKASLNLRDLLRIGASDREILAKLKFSLGSKKANGWEAEKDFRHQPKESMAFIGG